MLDDPVPQLKEELRKEIVRMIKLTPRSLAACYFHTDPARMGSWKFCHLVLPNSIRSLPGSICNLPGIAKTRETASKHPAYGHR